MGDVHQSEMYIMLKGPRLRNDLYCVEWDVKLYYTIPIPKRVWTYGVCAVLNS